MKSFQHLTEELESVTSTRHLDALVRAGLIDKTQLSRLHRVLDKMSSGPATFTGKDRDILYDLLQRLVSLVTDHPQLYAKTLQTIRAESVQTEDVQADMVDSHGIITTAMPPAILILKRKQIRSYAHDMYVALYHNDRLNRFFSIPYQHDATVESWVGLLELIAEQATDSLTDLTCMDGTVFQVTPMVAQTTLRMIKQVGPALQESVLTHLMESATSFGQTTQFLITEDAQVSENAEVSGNARVSGDSVMKENAQTHEIAKLDEATVKTQTLSWGKMMTVYHGIETSYPLHPEHQAAIKKLQDGEKTTFTDETRRRVMAHRVGDQIHLSTAGTNKKTMVAYSYFTDAIKSHD